MSNELQKVDATPAMMIQTALEKGASIEQLTALFELQERWEANQAKKAFNKAVADFKSDPPQILKTHAVKFNNVSYRHALLEDIVESVTPALTAVGLSVRWDIDQGNQVGVKCILSHVDGHSESVYMYGPSDTSGSKNAIQSIGSTVSYLQRYTLMSILGLAAKGVDDDGRSAIGAASDSNKIDSEQLMQIDAFIAENELPMGPILAYLKSKGCETFADLPAKQFDFFMATLKRSAAAKAKL